MLLTSGLLQLSLKQVPLFSLGTSLQLLLRPLLLRFLHPAPPQSRKLPFQPLLLLYRQWEVIWEVFCGEEPVQFHRAARVVVGVGHLSLAGLEEQQVWGLLAEGLGRRFWTWRGTRKIAGRRLLY